MNKSVSPKNSVSLLPILAMMVAALAILMVFAITSGGPVIARLMNQRHYAGIALEGRNQDIVQIPFDKPCETSQGRLICNLDLSGSPLKASFVKQAAFNSDPPEVEDRTCEAIYRGNTLPCKVYIAKVDGNSWLRLSVPEEFLPSSFREIQKTKNRFANLHEHDWIEFSRVLTYVLAGCVLVYVFWRAKSKGLFLRMGGSGLAAGLIGICMFQIFQIALIVLGVID